MQRFLTVNISSVNGCFLCDQDQFFYTLFRHLLCLFQQTFHRNASEFASKFRNNTVSTMLIASFCNLEISEMSTGCQHTLSKFFRKIIDILEFLKVLSFHCFIDRFKNISVRSGTKYCINFRYFLDDLIFVTLCHTSCYDKNFTASGFLVFCHLKDGVYTFFLRVIDEAAGIYHDCLCFCLIVYDFKSVAGEKSKHLFRINEVLVTA